MLKHKKIILGITGSIAAYKTASLIRLLKKQGAEVQVIASTSALSFIPPLTLATLSEKPVLSAFVKDDSGQWNNHVALGLWADLILIAPASANTIAKMAHGQCDNLLMAVYLSARCPVMVAPAMDLDMFAHPSTSNNIQLLEKYGNHIIDAREGLLASGLEGKGRMAEPEELLEEITSSFSHTEDQNILEGKNVLITAGPTYEYIDPVRYISNGSSGKMGYAIAEHLALKGANVTLISGPVNLKLVHPNICILPVTSAQEMFEATQEQFPNTDIAIFAAAVADYTPITMASQKIKKKGDTMHIELKKTMDIAKEMGKLKTEQQILVGFALETNDELGNAQKKLAAKNLDFIVLNSLNDKGAGFGHDTNKITIVDAHEVVEYELKSKQDVAQDIVQKIIYKLEKQH